MREEVSWQGAKPAPGLVDRRVEITGPVSPSKMVINASNSGATQFMADFEGKHQTTIEVSCHKLYDLVALRFCLEYFRTYFSYLQ